MELRQIEYFLAVCQARNFTRAAQACNVTQPALTKSLKLLEFELGGELIDRQAKPMRLTDLGELLVEKFRKLHDLKNNIAAQASLFSNMDSSTHTIGIVNTIGEEKLFQLSQSIQLKFPCIALSISMLPQQALEEKVLEGCLELAIFVDKPNQSRWCKKSPLFTETFVLALPEHHALSDKKTITTSDLHNVNYIRRDHCEMNDIVDAYFEHQGIKLNTQLSTDQEGFASQMIEAGLGVSIMPKALGKKMSTTREISDFPFQRTLSLFRLSDRILTKPAQLIQDLILQQETAIHAPA